QRPGPLRTSQARKMSSAVTEGESTGKKQKTTTRSHLKPSGFFTSINRWISPLSLLLPVEIQMQLLKHLGWHLREKSWFPDSTETSLHRYKSSVQCSVTRR
ncbi:mCG145310, partial [Mus musculus]